MEVLSGGSWEQWRLRDLIYSVCARPKMYVADGSFDLCAAFIDGYTIGRGGAMREELDGFRYWLAQCAYAASGFPRNYGWQTYIRQLYPDDALVFAELPALLDRFLLEYGSEPDGEFLTPLE